MFFLLACLGLIVPYVKSISFDIVPDERKCVREEVHQDVLVVGDYTLSEIAGQRTDIMVNGKVLTYWNECNTMMWVF